MSNLKVMKGVAFTEKRLAQWLAEDGQVVCQPKRDEIRCVIRVNGTTVTYTSAQGKPLYNLAQFDDLWLYVYADTGIDYFDTGVLVNNSFDITRRVLRASTQDYNLKGEAVHSLWSKNPTKKNPDGILYYGGELRAKFWLYDLPEYDAKFRSRLSRLDSIAAGSALRYSSLLYYRDIIAVPETFVMTQLSTVESKYEHCIDAGLEGLMIKRFNHDYERGRSTDWMKMKPGEEKDGIITGFTDGKGKFAGLIGSATIDFGDGSGTSVSGMDDATRLDMSRNTAKYLGKVARIPYMQRDSQGGYRHPRWGGLHEDKSREDVLSSPNR